MVVNTMDLAPHVANQQQPWYWIFKKYRKTSNISRTKSQNLNDSRLILQFSLPHPLKPGVKSRMKM